MTNNKTRKKQKMRNILTALMAAAAATVTFTIVGCKSLPTPDKMNSVAYAVGTASGLVANETKIDDKSRETVIEVVTVVKGVVPTNGQTFVEAWVPVADVYVAELVAKGKLNEGQALLVKGGTTIVATGMDYVFKAYPKAKEYEDLVVAAVDGFTDGFLTTFKPVNLAKVPGASGSSRSAEYDKEAYIYLKECFGK